MKCKHTLVQVTEYGDAARWNEVENGKFVTGLDFDIESTSKWKVVCLNCGRHSRIFTQHIGHIPNHVPRWATDAVSGVLERE
jgi:hypothetical protein